MSRSCSWDERLLWHASFLLLKGKDPMHKKVGKGSRSKAGGGRNTEEQRNDVPSPENAEEASYHCSEELTGFHALAQCNTAQHGRAWMIWVWSWYTWEMLRLDPAGPGVRSSRNPSRVWLSSHGCEWGQFTQRLVALSVSSPIPRTCRLNILGRGKCNPLVGSQLPPPISAFWEVFFLLNPNPLNLVPHKSFTWMGRTGWGALRWKYRLCLPSYIMLRPHSQQQQCKTAGSPRCAGTWRGHT